MKLWEQFSDWKKNCKWVELSREVSPDTVHWAGFPAMEEKKIFDVVEHGFDVYVHSLVGQYGTHADAPSHFVAGAQTLESFTAGDMVMPLCVIDASAKCAENPDYALAIEDILAWEEKHGRIPEGAFVAFRSDWYKRGGMAEMQNADAEGKAHYPGWAVETIKFLVEERNIASIGHEASDTDPAAIGPVAGYPGEYYILSQKRFQIELLINLDQVPEVGAIIFCTFPKVRGGAGFTARCFALCEK
ncbi:MAG: cyclase family protein [Phascolarctobacterium sp.]|nr:cyclase family protein [Phascolarctobacterium sp.]